MNDPPVHDLTLLFPADPFARRQPDEVYAAELEAAATLGLRTALLDFEALADDGSVARAVRWLPESSSECTAVYRGWMLRPERYGDLFLALVARGYRLITTPEQYALTHQLPNWYSLLEQWTPRSVWMSVGDALDPERRTAALGDLVDGPLIVKDYVKSQEHAWDEACFVPDARDERAADRVVRRFLELQGPDLNEGIVFRRFEQFRSLGRHPQSGMPISREYRVFVIGGQPATVSAYRDDEGADEVTVPADDVQWVTGAVSQINSHFFTVDIAEREDGVWRVVELGDGQVAGLPDHVDPLRFHTVLAGRLIQ